MSDTIRAIRVESFDGPASLALGTAPSPETQDIENKVVVGVAAAGVGFPDVLASYGRHQKTPALPFTPGLEIAGIVRSAPPGSPLEAGTRVMAFTSGFGGWSDTVAVDPRNVYPAPADFTAEQAATFILNYHTAFFALTERTRVSAGETVVVLGAAGGLGMACVQICAALGASVIAVASTGEKRAAAIQAGAHQVAGDVHEASARLEGFSIGTADVVVDPVGGAAFDQAIRLLGYGGRLVSLGFASGTIPTLAVNRLLLRNASVVGAAWSPTVMAPEARAASDAALAGVVAARPGVRPFVSASYPLEEARQAAEAIENRAVVGRVALTCAFRDAW